MTSLFIILFLLSFGEQTESFSKSGRQFQNHALRRKLISQRALSSQEENEDFSISSRVLENVGKRVTKNKGIREINLELVSLGQEFDSFRRRFDYLSLLKGSGQIDNRASLWIRDNDQSVNLVPFLQSSRGMSMKEANAHAQSLFTQSYDRVITSDDTKELKKKQQLHTGSNIRYEIKTHKGKPALVHENDGVDCAEKTVSWEANKYVTKFVSLKDTENAATSLREERYLSSLNDIGSAGNNLILIVNSTIFFHGAGDEATKSVTCQEIFRPVYFIDEESMVHKERLTSTTFSSPVDRVPGCVANVNVRTTLIAKENDIVRPGLQRSFYVTVDGEADTLLSRGLLSVLSSALSRLTSSDVLKIDPFTIADELKLRRVLSAGRNDGLSNMVSVVQRQILQIVEAQNVETFDNKNADETDEKYLEKPYKPTVAMLLSGGVDSAVALNLLCQQNYNVTAFYLKIWLEDELAHLGNCPWEDDYNTCIEVVKHAGNISLEAISLQDAYKERVISYTIEEAKKGRTPNPDIMCNRQVVLSTNSNLSS